MNISLKKLLKSPLLLPLTAAITIIIAFVFYYSRLTEFHFVDEINNIAVGYFMVKGKALYSGVFFNHQMLMADISYFLQLLLHPNTLYKLIFYHRLFVFIFSLIMDILLIWRFRWKAVGFVLFFETFKYYLFGDLFLAEALIVQPLVYLLGVALEAIDKKTIKFSDLILGSVFAWFVIFMREPFVPVALLLFVFLFFFKSTRRNKLLSLILFFILSFATLFSVNLRDYFFQVITINSNTIAAFDAKQNQLIGFGGLNAFLYPFTLFLNKTLNFTHVLFLYISGNAILAGAYLIYKRKFLFQLAVIFITLGLANIRFVSPSTQFYAGFHMLPWFGLFCFSLFFLLEKLFILRKKPAIIISGCLILFFTVLIFIPNFYIHLKINKETDFTTNYGNYYSIGQAIKLSANPKDTVFVDGYDTLVYWQADLPSAYKYSLYIPVMQYVQTYSKEREDMFNNHLPTFYFIDCGKAGKTNAIPDKIIKRYSQIVFNHKTQCLYVDKNKVSKLTGEQLDNLYKLGYSF